MSDVQPFWLRVRGAAVFASVSQRTIWSWISQGLPFSKVGGITLISRDAINAFIEARPGISKAGELMERFSKGKKSR